LAQFLFNNPRIRENLKKILLRYIPNLEIVAQKFQAVYSERKDVHSSLEDCVKVF
jgi:hypothetical protein